MLLWFIGFIVLVIVLVILDREIYFYEGVHLGPRIQGWLYDRWAAKYDSDKQESQANDAEVLARPLLKALDELQSDTPKAFILDVATGTGRLPAALLRETTFEGHIIALDISREMLARAAEKLAPFEDRVTLIRHSALPLPFPDQSFDVVSCMEALELMPNMADPAAELARVLRPGGILLTTRGTEASGRVKQILSAEKFSALLQMAGFEQIKIIPWWKNFDRVWARKSGTSAPVGARAVTAILRCPRCTSLTLTSGSTQTTLLCETCHAEVPITLQGIILC